MAQGNDGDGRTAGHDEVGRGKERLWLRMATEMANYIRENRHCSLGIYDTLVF